MSEHDDAILSELGKLNTAVGELRGTTQALAESLKTINGTLKAHNRRLSALEGASQRAMGFLGAFGGIARVALVVCGGAVGSLVVIVAGGHP